MTYLICYTPSRDKGFTLLPHIHSSLAFHHPWRSTCNWKDNSCYSICRHTYSQQPLHFQLDHNSLCNLFPMSIRERIHYKKGRRLLRCLKYCRCSILVWLHLFWSLHEPSSFSHFPWMCRSFTLQCLMRPSFFCLWSPNCLTRWSSVCTSPKALFIPHYQCQTPHSPSCPSWVLLESFSPPLKSLIGSYNSPSNPTSHHSAWRHSCPYSHSPRALDHVCNYRGVICHEATHSSWMVCPSFSTFVSSHHTHFWGRWSCHTCSLSSKASLLQTLLRNSTTLSPLQKWDIFGIPPFNSLICIIPG